VKEFGSKEPKLGRAGSHRTIRCAVNMSSAGLVNWLQLASLGFLLGHAG
jgi:hypothetical protein